MGAAARGEWDVFSAKFSEGEQNEGKSERHGEKNDVGRDAEERRRGSELEL